MHNRWSLLLVFASGLLLGTFMANIFVDKHNKFNHLTYEILNDSLRVRFYKQIEKNTTPTGVQANTLWSELSSQVRIVCLVLTTVHHHDRHAAVLSTWGRKCDKLYFVVAKIGKIHVSEYRAPNTSCTAAFLSVPIDEHYDNLWGKIVWAFRYVHRTYRDDPSIDWILKCDDDTFIVMENLRLFLLNQPVNGRMYYGFYMRLEGGFNYGGPGYLLHRRYLDALVKTFNDAQSHCAKNEQGAEDVEMSWCMDAANIQPAETLDAFGRIRFVPNELHQMLNRNECLLHLKLTDKQWDPVRTDESIIQPWDCISDELISFHHLRTEELWMFEYLLYFVNPMSSRTTWMNFSLSNAKR